MQSLIEKYNDRTEEDILISNVLEDFATEIFNLYQDLKTEMDYFIKMGIDIEEN